MEYAKDSAFVKDFVHRTKENIRCGTHPYEVTQLINSLIGLLILPKERYYRYIKNDMIDADLFSNITHCITVNTSCRNCSLKYIVRRMRNAIAHFHVECKADKHSHEIDKIVFSDYDNDNKKGVPDFQISLSIDLVKSFVNQFSDAVSKAL